MNKLNSKSEHLRGWNRRCLYETECVILTLSISSVWFKQFGGDFYDAEFRGHNETYSLGEVLVEFGHD